MKSFISYPNDVQQLLYPKESPFPKGRLVAHYELYKQVKDLEGSILKCGIDATEGFTRFAIFRQLMNQSEQQSMVAFEKPSSIFETTTTHENETVVQVKKPLTSLTEIQEELMMKGLDENVAFRPGPIQEAIPEYLMQNPELKIALLNIDLDDYDATLTTLDFFYQRIVSGGVLILDNYHKNGSEAMAVREFFRSYDVEIQHFSLETGPFFVVKS